MEQMEQKFRPSKSEVRGNTWNTWNTRGSVSLRVGSGNPRNGSRTYTWNLLFHPFHVFQRAGSESEMLGDQEEPPLGAGKGGHVGRNHRRGIPRCAGTSR